MTDCNAFKGLWIAIIMQFVVFLLILVFIGVFNNVTA